MNKKQQTRRKMSTALKILGKLFSSIDAQQQIFCFVLFLKHTALLFCVSTKPLKKAMWCTSVWSMKTVPVVVCATSIRMALDKYCTNVCVCVCTYPEWETCVWSRTRWRQCLQGWILSPTCRHKQEMLLCLSINFSFIFVEHNTFAHHTDCCNLPHVSSYCTLTPETWRHAFQWISFACSHKTVWQQEMCESCYSTSLQHVCTFCETFYLFPNNTHSI